MSTPSKRGTVGVTNATLTNIMPQLKEDTHDRLFDGATIEDFVQSTWGIPVEDMNHILSGNWSLDPGLLQNYGDAKPESEMYEPFSRLAENLTTSVRSSLGKGDNPMTFWNSKGTHVIKNLFTLRKPDMLAMHKDSSVMWLMVFIIIEFKRSSSTGSGSNASSRNSSRSTLSLSGIPEDSAGGDLLNMMTSGFRKSHSKPRASSISVSNTRKRSQPKASSSVGGSRTNMAQSVTENRRSPHLVHKMVLSSGGEMGSSVPPSVASSKKRRHSGNDDDDAVQVSKRARNSQSNSPHITNDQMQLATYALEAMAVSTRRFATGIFIDKFILSLWYYDRACVIRTISIDFSVEVAKFALILYAISTCSPLGAGFDPFLCRNPSTPPLIEDKPLDEVIGAHMVFPLVAEQDGGLEMRFCIYEILYTYRGLIGRGTMVYRVSQIYADGQVEDEQVLKLSYPVITRPREADTVAKLLSAIPEWKDHLPEISFSATYTAERLGLPRVQLLERLPLDKVQLEDRSLHVLSMSLYEKLWEVDDVTEFQNVFIDCVECKLLRSPSIN